MSSVAYKSLPVPLRVASWVVRLIVAIILVQTLFFKFSGAPESVYIFETVGQEPWGRYGSGVVELIAAVLLFVPAFVPVGAGIALGVISGAIFFHLTKLGIVVQDDGGLLFALAVVVFFGSAFIAWIHRRDLPVIGNKL
jgi:putative oxidoreductase